MFNRGKDLGKNLVQYEPNKFPARRLLCELSNFLAERVVWIAPIVAGKVFGDQGNRDLVVSGGSGHVASGNEGVRSVARKPSETRLDRLNAGSWPSAS